MKVEAIYHPGVMTVQPDDRLEVAAKRMRDSQVRSLVALEGNWLRGILTEHDITCAVADGVDASAVAVWEYHKGGRRARPEATVEVDDPLPVIVPPAVHGGQSPRTLQRGDNRSPGRIGPERAGAHDR